METWSYFFASVVAMNEVEKYEIEIMISRSNQSEVDFADGGGESFESSNQRPAVNRKGCDTGQISWHLF